MGTQAGLPGRQGRKYVAAMLLGTALSAMGSSPALADRVAPSADRAVNDITRYCTACWRNAHLPADCWNDCTQEVFSRLMRTLDPDCWAAVLQSEGEERREFLRAIDAVKKRTQRAQKRSTNLVGVLADARDAQERRLADDREVVDLAATELLSGRQQRILQMSFEGWSVHDIAEEMALPAERVSDEKYKAIRKLREHLCRSERAPEAVVEE